MFYGIGVKHYCRRSHAGHAHTLFTLGMDSAQIIGLGSACQTRDGDLELNVVLFIAILFCLRGFSRLLKNIKMYEKAKTYYL